MYRFAAPASTCVHKHTFQQHISLFDAPLEDPTGNLQELGIWEKTVASFISFHQIVSFVPAQVGKE